MLCKSFFIDTRSILEISKTLEINKAKDKWSDLSHVVSDIDLINHILNHKTTPSITGFGIKKLLDRVTMKKI